MSFRQILPLAVLVTAFLPASALAAPTVTVTGDDGNPVPLNALEPVTIRNMDVTADVTVPQTDTRYYTSQVLDAAGTPASSLSTCRETRFGPTWKHFTDYRGTGPTAWSCAKGRFTKRFKLRKTGTYRLRYTYKGSSLVAGGRVTEQVRIRRRVFFG
jgi:hypothetical protein